jgi:hypothetical protein
MEALAKLKAVYDGALALWARVSKIGAPAAWFIAGFVTAKLVSCLLT